MLKVDMPRVLARPYLMILYIISQPIWISQFGLKCVLKVINQRKKQCIVLPLLDKGFSFSKRRFYYIVHAFGNLFLFFHVSLSIIYLLFLPYHVLYTWFFLNIFKGFSLWQFSFNILNIWKNLLFFFIKQKIS